MKLLHFPWISSVLLSAALGWFGRGLTIGDRPVENPSLATGPAVLAPEARSAKQRPPVSTAAPVSASGKEHRLALQEAFANKDPYARMRRVLELLENTSAANVEDLRDAWRDYLASGMPKYSFDYFINRSIAKALGAAALVERTGRPADFSAIGAVGNEIEGAMQSDPKGVRDWYDSLTNEGFREALLGPYVSALARADLPSAMTVMDQLPAEFQQKCARAIIGGLKSDGGAEAVFDWVKSTLSDPSAASAPWAGSVFDQAVMQTSGNRQGAVRCAAFLEEVAGQSYASMEGAVTVAHRYAQMAPIEALEWSARMAGKPNVADGLALTLSALQGTADGDLNQAAEWSLKNLTGANRDSAAAFLLSRSSALNPSLRSELEKVAAPVR